MANSPRVVIAGKHFEPFRLEDRATWVSELERLIMRGDAAGDDTCRRIIQHWGEKDTRDVFAEVLFESLVHLALTRRAPGTKPAAAARVARKDHDAWQAGLPLLMAYWADLPPVTWSFDVWGGLANPRRVLHDALPCMSLEQLLEGRA